MHRRWDVSLLGVGMEDSVDCITRADMSVGTRTPLCEQLLSLPITASHIGCVISVTPII